MAYREFYKPQDIILTDYSPVAQGFANLFQGVAANYSKRKAASDQYKYALDYSKFENDNKFNEAYVKGVTRMARENFRKSTTPSQQLVEMEEQGRRYAADQKAQHQQFTDLNARIDKKGQDDVYYDPEVDKETLQKAAFGEDGDIDFRTRGSRLQDVANTIGDNPLAFRRRNYVSDWVKTYGEKTKEKKYGNSTVESSKTSVSPFWDEKTGSPGVTDKHVQDYLNSRDDVQNSLSFEVKNEISNEADQIKKLISQGDERVQKLKGLNDGELMLHLIGNEQDNVVNKKSYNERIREKAKGELQDAAKITLKTDINYKEPKSVNNVSNDQRHEFAFYDNPIGDSETRMASPGGTLMQKNGKPLQIQSDSESSFDLRTGKQSKRTGESQFNLTGYQLVPAKSDGKPAFISGNSVDEIIKNINGMSDQDIANMQPELKVGLRGYSIDRNNAINDVNTKKSNLESQLGEAIDTGDKETQARIEAQIDKLESLKNNLGLDEVSDDDLMSSFRRNNVTTNSIRYDEVVMPSQADLKKVKGITTASDGTGGLNLGNKTQWSDDMRKLDAAFKKRHKEASEKIAAGTGTADTFNAKTGQKMRVGGQKPVTKKQPIQVKLKESYSINGKSYTVQQLKDMGYTEDKIKEAISLGNIN